MATLHERLDKIKSPKLQNQQHTAVVLSAVEDTLRDQKADFTATAYYAALLALLGQSITSTHGIVNKDLATSVVYLLDIVTSFVPVSLLRSKFTQILTSLAPALALPDAEAPLLRSSTGCLESLLVAQDSAAWALSVAQIGPRRALAALLTLAVDHRPKVRKRAQEALVHVLKNPPPSPALDHPAADMCAEAALQTLSDSIAASTKARKGGKGHNHNQQQQHQQHEPAISHSLQLVKAIATGSGGWPSKKIDALCELLMSVSRSSNEFLTMAAFEIFEVIFGNMANDFSSSKLPRLMEAISDLKPAQNDSQLLPPWIAVLSRGYDVSAQVNAQETFEKLPELFRLVASFLASESHNIRVSASECLVSFMANCVPSSAILEPSGQDQQIIEELAKSATGLLSIKYQASWVEVFGIIASMLENLKWRSFPYLSEAVKIVGDLRSHESFQGQREADRVIGAAIAAVGPEEVLNLLPLNVTNPKNDQPGRVWLLPLVRDHVSNTKLAYFRSAFVPLSEALFQRVLEFSSAGKTVEVKIFETLVHQTWQAFPGFCVLPIDLTTAFDQSFAELLATILYKQTELRVDVCKGLQNLVESNQAVLSLETEGDDLLLQQRITKEAARKNIDHLSSFASNLLAVLFNVYSETLPHFRGYILQCINFYLGITSEEALVETFTRVTGMLEATLQSEQGKPPKNTNDKMPPTSHTLMDLIVTISVHLPRTSFGSLFSLAAAVLGKESSVSDPQLVKKAYKLIPRLATTEAGAAALAERSTELQTLLISTSDKTPVPARRDRLVAIHEVVTFLPSSDLHFIPSVLSEVVLCCKETNEKARVAAFNLLVHMANRVSDSERNPPGTVIRNRLVPHMGNDVADGPATIEEFFTMVSAGLAGTAPHMVAATVSALARMLFDYYSKLSETMLTDLIETVDLFLTSNNREIVRAVLGFVKVSVVALPDTILRPRLASVVPHLMGWSKEHKGRLRMKVKGILDRLVRRFGAPFVEGLVGEQDRKLVVAIRKERERRKKKSKEARGDAESDEEGGGGGKEKETGTGKEDESAAAGGKKSFSNEFDRAVYGSDMSDLDISESEADASELDVDEGGGVHRRDAKPGGGGASKKSSSSGGDKASQRYIRELSPEDNPFDLLAPNALVNISSTKPTNRFLGTAKDKKRPARTNEDGKLVINNEGVRVAKNAANGAGGDVTMADDDNDAQPDPGAGVNAYLTAVSGPDSVRRGQKGKLKVSQSGVGNKRKDPESMDLDSDDDASAAARGGQVGGGRKVASTKQQRQGSTDNRSKKPKKNRTAKKL